MQKILVYTLASSNGVHLSKTKTTSYPLVKNFNSKEHTITTPQQLFNVINKAADTGHCLIKGMLTRQLNDESRARSTDPVLQTQWIVFDIDGAPYKSPEDFVHELPKEFHDVSYTTQYSASQGLKPGLRCHLFFLLKEPAYPVYLKTWLKHLNFSIPTLTNALKLTSTSVALLWPLDITVCQNDKIIYVASPQDRTDKKRPNPWVSFSKKKNTHVKFAGIKFDTNETRLNEKKHINRIRKDQNLSVRKQLNMKKIGTFDVLSNPGECVVTGHKIEREFNYLNLNGGDSWGYYHAIGKNEILFNFKGEPLYLIKELLPEYYKQINEDKDVPTNTIESEVDSSAYRYLAFCDAKTDAYYRGTFDEVENYLEIFKTNSLVKVKHFLKQHGQYVPDFIPEYDLIYDFHSDILVNENDKVINLYQKTEYMKSATKRSTPPALIKRLIEHVVNYDSTVYNHLINWLAFIIQTRKQTRTAWVFHGTQGTGKGVLFNKILLPILGNEYVFRTKLTTFEAEFNGFMEHSLLVLVDETQLSDLKRAPQAMAAIKQYISDSSVSIRRMRTDPYIVNNVSNFIFNSNKHDPIQVDAEDRRFNVAPRQETPLLQIFTDAQIDELCSNDNIQAFTNYLSSYKINKRQASRVIQTSERKRLQSLTQDAAEELVQSLKQGDLGFFVDNAPDAEDSETLKLKLRLRSCRKYEEIINECIVGAKTGAYISLSRTDLEVLCYYIIGVEYPTRHKFTKYIGHKGLTIQALNISGHTTRGVKDLKFNPDKGAIQRWTTRKNKSGKKKSTSKVVSIK